MIYSLPYKTKQFFFVLIKLSIVVGAFYFIYQKLANNEITPEEYKQKRNELESILFDWF